MNEWLKIFEIKTFSQENFCICGFRFIFATLNKKKKKKKKLNNDGPTLFGSKDLRGNPKPQVSPDRTETGPGSGNIF